MLCAEHARQLGGESPLPNLMEVKGLAKREGEITLAARRGLKETLQQRCELMNDQRIRGLRWRASEQLIAKPIFAGLGLPPLVVKF